MKPYYQDNHNKLYAKDCRQMTELADSSVQCVVTSPPYWGLRKYSGEQELIWGDNHCGHQWISERTPRPNASGGKPSPTNPYASMLSSKGKDNYKEYTDYHDRATYTNTCSLCGAWKGAYGLEPTPEMYVQHTIEILREIRRVLRKDGVVFWNIGDSYSGSWGNSGSRAGGQRPQSVDRIDRPSYDNYKERPASSYPQLVIKPKDLCLIPFRIAIAAQEDGWWVRSVIIWSKPNPMPESVIDRPTESHEYILMFTKSARYYWDQDAVRMPMAVDNAYVRPSKIGGNPKYQESNLSPNHMRNQTPNPAGRNIRTVWEFPTQPYPEAHFAVFPEKLPELCIKAATPEVGCCSKCGAPWERILDKKPSQFNIRVRDAKAGRATPEEGYKATPEEINGYPGNHPDPGYRQTIGWQPTCKCNADKVPSLVLDPFAGAGTTLWVAKKLNRQAVGYEISEEYCELALERNRQQVLELT